ncbi:hypothetical protein JJJ17_00155 [Paracoccus caeni]|uniref:Uncharacterized protein n=1 Tax=Paracoccus caeni TaxID=657651 RepID=A0A934S8Z4_9RHOB|nr:hypothetical protein [Paracoccus caeni]MBK4214326.1 hypothetical protein [Paracoccus caeni]
MQQLSTEHNDDLHLLMTVAVLSGKRGVDVDLMPIFELWEAEYPQDALGKVGRGLAMVHEGDLRGGYELIKKAAATSTSRVDQAQDALKSLTEGLGEYLD